MLIIKHLLFANYYETNLVHGGNFYFPNLAETISFINLFTFGLIVALLKYKIWLFILLSFYLFFKNKKLFKDSKKLINVLKINLILFFILLFGIYFSVINHDYGLSWWIDNSLDRIIYQISGLFVIGIIISINNIKIKV